MARRWRAAADERFDLAYTVHASTYHGRRDVQVQWQDFRPTQDSAVELHALRSIEMVDYRQQVNQQEVLQHLQNQGDLLVWREASARQEPGGQDRTNLAPAPTLVIWTTPPGPAELRTPWSKSPHRRSSCLPRIRQQARWMAS